MKIKSVSKVLFQHPGCAFHSMWVTWWSDENTLGLPVDCFLQLNLQISACFIFDQAFFVPIFQIIWLNWQWVQTSVNKYLKCLLVLSWAVVIPSDMHLYNKHFDWTRSSSTGTSNFMPHRGSKHSFTPNATTSKTSRVCPFGMGWDGHNRTHCVALLSARQETWSAPTARRRVEPVFNFQSK